MIFLSVLRFARTISQYYLLVMLMLSMVSNNFWVEVSCEILPVLTVVVLLWCLFIDFGTIRQNMTIYNI